MVDEIFPFVFISARLIYDGRFGESVCLLQNKACDARTGKSPANKRAANKEKL
jgi:hypothetical protein